LDPTTHHQEQVSTYLRGRLATEAGILGITNLAAAAAIVTLLVIPVTFSLELEFPL
jgi:hypothetical protein